MSKRRRVASSIPPGRLSDVLHQGGVSVSGLAKVMAALANDEARGRDRIVLGQLNRADFMSMRCNFDLSTVSGEPIQVASLDPGLWLRRLVHESPELHACYASAWEKSPPSIQSPWSLILAFDEFTPGNKLSVDQGRKTMVLSFAFGELGCAVLCQVSAWCTPLVIRNVKIAEVYCKPKRHVFVNHLDLVFHIGL